VKAIHFSFFLIIETNRIVIESHSECETNCYRRCLLVNQLLCDSLMLQLARNEFMHSRFFKIVAQFACYWFAFSTNDVRHARDLHAIFDLNLQLIQMQINENDIRFSFQNRNRNDSKRFKNVSLTAILYDCEFVNHFWFFILKHVLNKNVVNKNEMNNENVQHSSFAKNRFSNENRQFRENHDLFRHFFLNFSYVWVLFQSCVDLHVKNSNVDSRLNRVRINFDRDHHVTSSNFWWNESIRI
jgi:hypothetical protein